MSFCLYLWLSLLLCRKNYKKFIFKYKSALGVANEAPIYPHAPGLLQEISYILQIYLQLVKEKKKFSYIHLWSHVKHYEGTHPRHNGKPQGGGKSQMSFFLCLHIH